MYGHVEDAEVCESFAHGLITCTQSFCYLKALKCEAWTCLHEQGGDVENFITDAEGSSTPSTPYLSLAPNVCLMDPDGPDYRHCH